MLRVMIWNIRDGGKGRESMLAALIRYHLPDVVVFQEVLDSGWLEALGRELGMVCQVAVVTRSGGSPA